MKHTKEEIVAALRVIKDECASQNGAACTLCPFFIKGKGCSIGNKLPQSWDIVDIEPEKTWRAFK